MKELDRLMMKVDSVHRLTVRAKNEIEERFYNPVDSLVEFEDLHEELVELEWKIVCLDEDWVFLDNCKVKGKILDEGRYNGIKGEYKI